MSKLHSLLGRDCLDTGLTGTLKSKEFPYSTAVGLELELENCNKRRAKEFFPSNSGWKVIGDGSLRSGGIELVLRRPLKGRKLSNAMRKLGYYLDKVEPNATCGMRTSLHVHLDVLDLSVGDLYRLLRNYTILEDILFIRGGVHRKYNNNCIPSTELKEFADCVESLYFNRQHELIRILFEDTKYSSCNIRSIMVDAPEGRRGSLEIRMHEGTKDISRIASWVQLLTGLVEFSKDESEDLMDAEEYLLSLVDKFPEFSFINTIPNSLQIVQEGIRKSGSFLRRGILNDCNTKMVRASLLRNKKVVRNPVNELKSAVNAGELYTSNWTNAEETAPLDLDALRAFGLRRMQERQERRGDWNLRRFISLDEVHRSPLRSTLTPEQMSEVSRRAYQCLRLRGEVHIDVRSGWIADEDQVQV